MCGISILSDTCDTCPAGLQSLSPDELAVYMQLTEQLVSEGVSQPPASPKTGDAFDKTASQ